MDGGAGEAEKAGILKPGMVIAQINDATVSWTPFPTIIATLVNCGRPVSISFRDPEILEFRDSYRFLRTKLHVEKESAYLSNASGSAQANDRAWLAFLNELGGKRGASWGVQRLLRDAVGEVTFVVDPPTRLNAVSPIHGRCEGITNVVAAAGSAPSTPSRVVTTRPSSIAAAAAAAIAVAGAGSSSAVGSSPAYATPVRPSGAGAGHASSVAGPNAGSRAPANSDEDDDGGSPANNNGGSRVSKDDAASASEVIVSIYKRCWGSNSIGCCEPPGLSVSLPGELPKAKQREKLNETLNRLMISGGIPAAFRPAVWYELSGAHAKASLHPPSYYASLTAQTPSQDSAYAIAKDIDRTFPGHPLFESKAGIASLRRLLCAFSVHNPDIGYCQSINFLAGFLLLLLSEEQSFWVLDCLINEILPQNYYTNSLIGVHADQRVLAHLISELVPEVHSAYESAGVQLHIVTVEWFMCVMCTTLPTHTALRVWDAIFLHGSEVLFRVALVLFHMNRNRIISVANSSTRSQVSVKTVGAGSGAAASPLVPSSPVPSLAAQIVVSSSHHQHHHVDSNKSNGGSGGGKSSMFSRKPKDTVAETAAKAMAAITDSGVLHQPPPPMAATRATSDGSTSSSNNVTGVGDGGDGGSPALSPSAARDADADANSSSGGGGAVPSSPPPNRVIPSGPIARGGTIRSPLSSFPALFGMLKSFPQNMHDPDELLRLAFPITPKDAKDSLDWRYTAPTRLAKLRAAAKAAAETELDDLDAQRAAARESGRRLNSQKQAAAAAAELAAASAAATADSSAAASTMQV